MLDLTVIILTKNEEIHLDRAIASVESFAKKIVVVDSFSDDGTESIAKARGADFFQNKFFNQAQQFQWALENCGVSTDWIMRLDADEVIEEDLKRNILATLPKLDRDVVGINLKRKHIFWNRWIRHGGRYPIQLLRIWRTGYGRVEERWMDEHVFVWGGQTITLEGGFSDHNLNNLSYFTDKHNKYATREAFEVLISRYGLSERDAVINRNSTSSQASNKRWIKENIYNRLPFPVSATFYFLYRYVAQLGFLDGVPGFTYHFLQGYWYRLLVGAKVRELDAEIAPIPTRLEKKARLEEITGLYL